MRDGLPKPGELLALPENFGAAILRFDDGFFFIKMKIFAGLPLRSRKKKSIIHLDE